MYGRSASAVLLSLLVVCLSAGVALGANAGDVVINEIWVNSPDYYDDAEFIELYNTTGSYVDLGGWVLTGTEYDTLCGEHHHQIPAGHGIDAYGYFIIARDVLETDGFEARFGFLPDLEMYDNSQSYETDDPRVANTICQNPDAYDDQIRFFPGTSDYGMRCPTYTGYEALYLYDEPTRSNLIDAIEYRQSSCHWDACPGVNGSDNDAYPRYPNEGVSLGRDESGTDTDNSSADLYEEAATPRAQNVINLPPYGWALEYSPCVPANTDQVHITCYADDDDGTVAAVKCFYSVRVPDEFVETGFDSLAMTPVVGEPGQWECNLPQQGDEYQVRFYVRIADNLAATGYEPEDAPNSTYGYSIGLTAISTIQQVDSGDDSSYVLGQAKNITGIVTVSRGDFDYPLSDAVFVVEDQNGGPWSGIYVYDPSYSVQADAGDSVTLSGFISEYYNVTELYMFPDCYQEHKSGAAMPEPYLVTTSDLNTASASAERYEGVLVRVDGVIVTEDSLGNGEWEINDGSGSCRVDDAAYYAYVPQDGDSLGSVRGIGYYSFFDYKIEPRGDDDIIGPIRIYSLKYTPHAPTTTDVITVSATVLSDTTFSSVKLFHRANGGAWDSTTMTSPDSVFSANIGPYAIDKTVVDYYVEAWDVDGFSGRKPVAGSYDFRVGMNTIHEVQSVTPPADSSTYAGQPVNVSGIVTAAPGELSRNYFFIQNSYGGADTPEFDGVKVYDRTGSLSLSRGDSVTVSGDVWEYYKETEVAMFFPEAITVHSTGNTVPAPYPVTSGMIDSNEVWEGVLVEVNNGTVTDDKNTYGEWEVSNTVPDTSCTVGDNSWYDYDPTLGEGVLFVRGVMMYAYAKHMLEPRDIDDICAAGRAGADERPNTPQALAMLVRPNPIADGGIVKFALPVSSHVSLKVYNVKGELVRTLADQWIEAGSHDRQWNGTNTRGGKVSSGIYFVKLETMKGSLVNKVVVSR